MSAPAAPPGTVGGGASTANGPLRVDGVEVHVDGAGPEVIVMVHGWPDTFRLWDPLVATLAPRWRCVRFTLPGFDVGRPRRLVTLDAMTDFLARVVDAASPDRPVTLLLHDWGCAFGYQYLMRHPQRVARVIGIDIGDAGSRAHWAELRWQAKAGIVAYQLWLAAAWLVGGASRTLGDRMTRAMARWARCPAEAALIGAQMNYPYWLQWTGGYRGRVRLDPPCPMLYLYGTRKPFLFHSRRWAEALAARPGCRVVAMRTGHWLMCNDPAAFNREVNDWLACGVADGTAPSAAAARAGPP
ncbi:MAG: alpha/beta fold hydrolase [Burkholderiales bacterium]|nr:alpha/beta fold hydrolase [Burkholderiales bacterium]